MPNVVVYVPAGEARELEKQGQDVAAWVRRTVKDALVEEMRKQGNVADERPFRGPDPKVKPKGRKRG